MQLNDRLRAERRIQMYWAILKKAGFDIDEGVLKQRLSIDPGYNQQLRMGVYTSTQPFLPVPPNINTLNDLLNEFERITQFILKA